MTAELSRLIYRKLTENLELLIVVCRLFLITGGRLFACSIDLFPGNLRYLNWAAWYLMFWRIFLPCVTQQPGLRDCSGKLSLTNHSNSTLQTSCVFLHLRSTQNTYPSDVWHLLALAGYWLLWFIVWESRFCKCSYGKTGIAVLLVLVSFPSCRSALFGSCLPFTSAITIDSLFEALLVALDLHPRRTVCLSKTTACLL